MAAQAKAAAEVTGKLFLPALTRTIVLKQSELNHLAQQLKDLREALKPFTFFAESLPPIDPEVKRVTDDGAMVNTYSNMVNYTITFADLRRAKALLDVLAAEDYERWVKVAEDKMGPTQQEQLVALRKEVEALKKTEDAKMRAEREKTRDELGHKKRT